MPIVKLSPAEMEDAKQAGLDRNAVNRNAGRKSGIVVGSSIDADVQGARAELAVAKYFEIPWTGRLFTNTGLREWKANGGHDVGPLEVRSTHHLNGHLPLFKDSLNGSPYVLVIACSEDTYDIVGWCWGYEGKKDRFWADPAHKNKPYYCVPRTVLRPVEDLELALKLYGGL